MENQPHNPQVSIGDLLDQLLQLLTGVQRSNRTNTYLFLQDCGLVSAVHMTFRELHCLKHCLHPIGFDSIEGGHKLLSGVSDSPCRPLIIKQILCSLKYCFSLLFVNPFHKRRVFISHHIKNIREVILVIVSP